MLERKSYKDLLRWKEQDSRNSVLMIEGARRVGKTSLVREFGNREYKSMLFIDFAKVDRSVRQCFQDMAEDFDSLFLYLSTRYAVKLYDHDSLVVFDEVQMFPFARQITKYLVEDGRYDFIETGSLISLRENTEQIVIPSEEKILELNPFDFEEFLMALEEDALAEMIKHYRQILKPLPDDLHRKASRLFREYMLIGGMPAVVAKYAERRDFAECDAVKRDILNLYRRDISRFAKGYEYKVVSVFDQIPGQLSKHEKRFKLTSMSPEARMRNYESSFFWLSDARITNPCYRITDPSIDLRMTCDHNMVKCYMADTGLLVSHCFPKGTLSDKAYRDVLFGKTNLNEGMLTENIVAQALKSNGEDLLFYSSSGNGTSANRMEVDFLVAREFENAGLKLRVSPVEVKSSNRYSTLSLDKFKAKFGSAVGTQYVLHPRQLKVECERVFLPLYMSFCL